MRPFNCSFDNIEVDLDDPETYKHLPNNIVELEDRMFKNIGYYYCYVNYFHKDIKVLGWFVNQEERIDKLIFNFTENRRNHNYDDNLLWYQEQLFRFEDEIENMC